MVHLVEALDLLLDERGLLVDELLLRQLPRHQLLDQDRLRRLVVTVRAARYDQVKALHVGPRLRELNQRRYFSQPRACHVSSELLWFNYMGPVRWFRNSKVQSQAPPTGAPGLWWGRGGGGAPRRGRERWGGFSYKSRLDLG